MLGEAAYKRCGLLTGWQQLSQTSDGGLSQQILSLIGLAWKWNLGLCEHNASSLLSIYGPACGSPAAMCSLHACDSGYIVVSARCSVRKDWDRSEMEHFGGSIAASPRGRIHCASGV